MALPSLKQMVNRSQTGHHRALEALNEGSPLANAATPASAIRGYRICLRTLRGWDCITEEGELTDRGRELLAALDARREGARTM